MRTIPELKEGTHRAKASGTLPNGKPVVVNSDGTVSVVGSVSIAGSAGTPAVFETGAVNTPDVAFSTAANKLLFAYQDKGNSNYGTAIVGTVSGTSISFGTAVVFESASTRQVRLTYDSGNDKFVIVYGDVANSYYGTAVVATISGTSVSFGSPVVFNSALTSEPDIDYDVNAGKVLIGYTSGSNGVARVGTVSGTSISFGSASNFNSSTSVSNLSYDSDAQKTVIAYRDGDNSDFGNCVVATISGTSVSFGSEATFSASDSTYNISATYDSNAQKTVITFRDVGDSNKAKAIVGTISGTSISFGTAVVFNDSAQANFQMCAYDPYTKNVAIAYGDIGNSGYGTFINGTVSGTTISFSSEVVFEQPGYTQFISMAADTTSNKMVVSYQDYTNSERGTACVLTSAGSVPNLTSENYIGMSQGFAESTSTSKGTSVVFESGRSSIIDSTFDSTNNKIVIAYCDNDNSSYGTAIVGTVSGTGISFGTPVVFKSATLQSPIKITYDSTKDRIVVIYKNASSGDDGEIIVGEVSGTSITFGSSVVFESGLMNDGDVVYASNAQRILVSYKDELTSNNGFCCVVSIGGTGDLVPTVNSRQTFNAASTQYISSVYDSTNQKVVIVFRDNGDSSKGKAIVATVGSTSATFGSEAEFSASAVTDSAITFDSNLGKVIVAYGDDGNSSYGTAIVGTVSGTSISFGSATVFEEASALSLSSAFDSNLNKAVISYRDAGNSDAGTLAIGTVSGTSISFDTPFVFEGEVYNSTSVTFDSNSNKIVASFNDDDTNRIGTSAVITIGFENRGQVNDGSSATVDIIGSVSTNQSGLTPGQQYYVQTDGTIGETAGDPSVFAGTAISATSLVVKT